MRDKHCWRYLIGIQSEIYDSEKNAISTFAIVEKLGSGVASTGGNATDWSLHQVIDNHDFLG